jgi:putative membrane protein
MLLVNPVTELRRLLIPLVGLLVFGASQGNPLVGVAFIGVPVALGVARYVTTTYRIADGRIELQRGLLNRQRLSTPLDRVRTVDLTASVVHRLLGLTTVTVGTGSAAGAEDDRISLDALAVEEGRALRAQLLSVAPAAPDLAAPEPVAAAFEPRWLRYAPFTSAGIVILGGLIGGLAQLTNELNIRVDVAEDDLPGPTLLVALVPAVALLVLGLTVVGYLVNNWKFRLSRAADTWRVSRGLLTTRETSIDVDRLAGVSIGEQAGLRLARGARLSAIVTGLDRSDGGSEVLVPPAPEGVVRRAARAVLGGSEPVDAPLTGHGPAAVRRRYARALAPGALLAAVAVGLVVARLPAWPLAVPVVVVGVGLALAADRVRSLGHALTERHLVVRSGSLLRKREALATEHVIGWTFHATWFQRRAGLVTLVATTAGGRGYVRAPDVPVEDAVALADAAVPGLVSQFTR